MLGRLIATFVLLAAWGWGNFGLTNVAWLQSGKNAGMQMLSDDNAFMASQFSDRFWGHTALEVSSLILLIILVAIWWAPFRRAMADTTGLWLAGALAATLLLFAHPERAQAFYQQTDVGEFYMIAPSESAFWVPDSGDNKNSQAEFDSEDYLNSTKIASKLFKVPHAQLPNSNYWYGFGGNYYTPTGRLYIVDRAPVAREWINDNNTSGNAAQDRATGFACQSSEGHSIFAGVAISVEVHPQDAAKFMFNFGVHPPEGDPEDPKVIFASVWHGRSLSEVMDTKIRYKVGTMVCMELMSHTLVDDTHKSAEYMTQIQKTVESYLNSKGISLEYIGWADKWVFDDKVQQSLDRHFAAIQDQDSAKMLTEHIGTLQAIAVNDTLRRWKGEVPATVTFVPQGFTDAMHALFGGLVPKVTPTPAPAPAGK